MMPEQLVRRQLQANMATRNSRTMTNSIGRMTLVLLLVTITAAQNCIPEFDNCVVSRDCCQDLECVTGDWQYTTDSTCLSKRSQMIEAANLSLEDKKRLLQEFYEVQKVDKPSEEISKIAYKYRHDFPKLVTKLERKYGSFPDITKFQREGSNEL